MAIKNSSGGAHSSSTAQNLLADIEASVNQCPSRSEEAFSNQSTFESKKLEKINVARALSSDCLTQLSAIPLASLRSTSLSELNIEALSVQELPTQKSNVSLVSVCSQGSIASLVDYPIKAIEIEEALLGNYQVSFDVEGELQLPRYPSIGDQGEVGLPDGLVCATEVVLEKGSSKGRSNWKFVIVQAPNGEPVMRAGNKEAHPAVEFKNEQGLKRSRSLHHPSLAGFDAEKFSVEEGETFPVHAAGTIKKNRLGALKFVIDSGNYGVGEEGSQAINEAQREVVVDYLVNVGGWDREVAESSVEVKQSGS